MRCTCNLWDFEERVLKSCEILAKNGYTGGHISEVTHPRSVIVKAVTVAPFQTKQLFVTVFLLGYIPFLMIPWCNIPVNKPMVSLSPQPFFFPAATLQFPIGVLR